VIASRTSQALWKAAIAALAIYALVLNSLLAGLLIAPQAIAGNLDQNVAALTFVCGTSSRATQKTPVTPGEPRQHGTDGCVLCAGGQCITDLPAGSALKPDPVRKLVGVKFAAPRTLVLPRLIQAAAQPRGPPAE
jgi:hypothetical protein